MKFLDLAVSAVFAFATVSCRDATDPKTALRDVQITPAVTAVHIGDTLVLHPTLFSQAGSPITGPAYQWASSNSTVATVDANGVVHAKALGRTVVAATTEGITGYATIDVAIVGYSLSPDTNRILVGDTRQLLGRLPPGPNDPTILLADAVWTSSDESVARVSPTGVVTGVKNGHATITASYRSETLRAEVYVVTLPKLRFVSHASSCGITDTQTMYCWGRLDGMPVAEPVDKCGSLILDMGHGNFQRYTYRCSSTPVPIRTPEPFVAFLPGSECGMTASHRAYCLVYTAGPTYQLYHDGQEFLSIEDGCAITLTHDAMCSGDNRDGSLGIGRSARFDHDTTVTIPGGMSWKQTTGDDPRCGLTLDGVAYCWGPDQYGELGLGNSPSGFPLPIFTSPTAVKTNLRFTQLKTRAGATCGLATDQLLYCWGLLPGRGSATSGVPVVVDSSLRFSTFSMSGWSLVCGLTSSARSYCFGTADYYFPATRPNPIPFGPDVALSSIDVFGDNACGLGLDGILYCWGVNIDGRLGSGSYDPTSAIIRVVGQ